MNEEFKYYLDMAYNRNIEKQVTQRSQASEEKSIMEQIVNEKVPENLEIEDEFAGSGLRHPKK
jgi:hypothetical protein